jgi:hypothetical protein
MRRYLFLFFTALTLCSCQKGPTLGPGNDEFLATAAETDCGFVQNAYGQRVSWKKNIPVTLQIHKSYPPEYTEVLTRAAQHWNEAAGMILLRVVPASASVGEKAARDATNTIHWQLEWPEASKNQQAVTNLHWRLNQLIEADISVDQKYFNFYVDRAVSPFDVHLESLLIHEMGHVLGLKHRSTVPSVMWAVLNGAVERDTLSAADRETIKCEY